MVGPGLVLTAWHVVWPKDGGPPPEEIRVRILRDYLAAKGNDRLRTRPARVVWPRAEPGRDHDFALLQMTDGPTGPGDDAVPWADLPASGEVHVETLGFPDLAIVEGGVLEGGGEEPVRRRETRAAAGTVLAGSGLTEREAHSRGTFEIALRPEALPDGPAIGWEGMSGAAVFAGTGLVGVVRDAAEARSSLHKLKALPVGRLFRQADVREALAQAGLAAPPRAEPLVDVAEALRLMTTLRMRRGYVPITDEEVAKRPTALVVADYGVVPYDDSRGLLGALGDGRKDTLLGWATSGGGKSVRLMHAAGGRGKTRLALEAVTRLNGDLGFAWQAGLVRHAQLGAALDVGGGPLAGLLERRGASGVFLAIDYAEAKSDQVRRLAEVLAEAPLGGPIRVLLLARTDAWWAGCLDAIGTVARGAFDEEPVAAAGTVFAAPDRARLFEAACAAFADRLSAAPREPGAPPLAAADWQFRAADPGRDGSPLDLSLRAYLRVRGVGVADSPLATMAHEERLHVRRALRHELASEPREPVVALAARSAAALTLLQGLASGEGEDALTRLVGLTAGLAGRHAEPRERDAVVGALLAVYSTKSGAVLPILPDLVGEQAVGEALSDAPALLPAVLDAFPEHRTRALTVLNRITRRAEGRAPVHDAKVAGPSQAALRAALGPRLVAPGFADALVAAALAEEGEIQEAALAALAGLDGGARGAAARVIMGAAARLVSFSVPPVRLRGFLGAVAWNAADSPSDGSEAASEERARLATTRSVFLVHAGLRREALAAAEEAAGLYRELAVGSPDAFRPALANALTILGVGLSNLGRREEALAAAKESVQLSRNLAADSPDAFRPALANALTNLALGLSALGRRETALAAAEEAARLYRELAEDDPDAFRPDLAKTFTNLLVGFSALGRREAALAAAEEAAWLYRELAATSPDAFRPDLARALNNLGVGLSDLGRREAALAATEEAARLYRELAEDDPDAFRPDLAMALTNLGPRLSDLGRREEALAATEEAARLYRELAAGSPDAFRPNLAMTLNNLGVGLSNLDRREEALAAAEEAAWLHRELAAGNPDVFRPDLAMALSNLGLRLSDVGRCEEALAASEEAAGLYRELAAGTPDAFRPDLALALTNLGPILSELDRREEALAAAEEAARLYRELAAGTPDAFRPALAMALTNLGLRLSNVGRREEALAAAEEAAGLYRELAAGTPDTFRPDLALALTNLWLRLSDVGRHEEALAATEEAARLYRELAAGSPDAFRPNLAMTLTNLGVGLSELDRREEALAAAEEAAGLYRELAAGNPDAFRPNLALALTNLWLRLSDVGRREEALAASEEAARLYRELAAGSPDAFRPNLAMTLTNLGFGLSELDRREEALAAAEEAAGLYRELAAGNPEAFSPNLAGALTNLELRLSELDRREEALAAAEEAAWLYRELAAGNPDAFRPHLAMTLNILGLGLSNLDRREAGLAATEEAVRLYRELAAASPDTFRPALARSLSIQGAILGDQDPAGALRSFEAALRALSGPFLADPEAFAQLMQHLRGMYLGACKTAAREPDEELLAPLAAALEDPVQGIVESRSRSRASKQGDWSPYRAAPCNSSHL
nr:tetratricopeptide repeat protein [Paracraurococcus ruber]